MSGVVTVMTEQSNVIRGINPVCTRPVFVYTLLNHLFVFEYTLCELICTFYSQLWHVYVQYSHCIHVDVSSTAADSQRRRGACGWMSSPLQQGLFIDSSDSHAGVADRGTASALNEREDNRALMLTGALIYSLTDILLLGSASEDHFHLFHLQRFEAAVHLVSNLS